MTSHTQNNNLKIFSGKQIEIPSMFISGEKDWGMYQKPGALKIMQKKTCKNKDVNSKNKKRKQK